MAKRENSVILYESDYKTRYAGFNPNSSESYIIFEFMQDKYMQQSVHLASLVQQQFRQHSKRLDKGVHQAGFLVLKASAMPSILVELGFISTPEEERYLSTDHGTSSLASSIYRAFLTYKREQEIRLTGRSDTPVLTERSEKELPLIDTLPVPASERAAEMERREQSPPRQDTNEKAAPVFKIQILTSDKPLPKNDRRFKGLTEVDHYKEGKIYKYTYAASTDYNKVLREKRKIGSLFKDAFIIAFRGEEKMNVNEAISEFKKTNEK